MARLAFQDDEHHPAGLVGLGEGGLGIPPEQGLVQRFEQRFEAFQTPRPRCPPPRPDRGSRQWSSNRSVGRWLKNLSSRISTHTDTPNSPLGISFGAGGAVTVRGPFAQEHVRW